MFQLLKYLPEPIALGLLGVASLVIILLPFIDRSPERHPAKRPVAVWAGILFILVTVGLGVLGALSETRREIFGNTYHFDTQGIPNRIEPTVEASQ